ncbi:MAG: serine/threonine protein kinase [Verrucomicrobiae bacterium]|nr:serine/threonine protein kinase [Verrucomicrobiae bacterium]
MPRSRKRTKRDLRQGNAGLDAPGRRCDVCGEPLKGLGIGGTCQSCLLVQPPSALWDPREPPSAKEVSEALPRFEIHDVLGRGALGIVYRATDTHLERTVAIKVMFANPDNPEFAHRFAREASAMAKLNHPNIVTMHDYGTAGALHFLVMEWMEGGTLEEEMSTERTLPLFRAVEVIGQISEALDYAHSQGVIHRDVKPGNILLDRDGTAKLSDFGLVKGLLQEEFAEFALTRTNMVVGTPLYMAPEQMEGSAKVDHRADIYSAGAVLYEMLTGEPAKGRYRPVSDFAAVPRSFNAVIDRALHPSSADRYERISEFHASIVSSAKVPQRRAKLAAMAAVYSLFGVSPWMVMAWNPMKVADDAQAISAQAKHDLPLGTFHEEMDLKKDQRSVENGTDPQEAIEGLPLGSFEAEVDLTQWQRVADYDFELGTGDMAHKQEGEFTLFEGARVKDGHLRLTDIDDKGYCELKRDTSRPLLGLAIHYRFKPDEYLAVGRRNIDLVEFAHYSVSGLRVVSTKWGDPRPTVMLGDYQPLAPTGVIEPNLEPGQWHEVWLLIGDGCRLWINGDPVYHSDDPMIEAWANWSGDETARLAFTGFRGLVDYVEIWEQF